MNFKVEDLKKQLEEYPDEYIVNFYSFYDGSYCKKVDVQLRFSLPRKTDFKHTECKYYEEMIIKGEIRGFCNCENDFINKDAGKGSCDNFIHKNKNVDFCLACTRCYKSRCNGI